MRRARRRQKSPSAWNEVAARPRIERQLRITRKPDSTKNTSTASRSTPNGQSNTGTECGDRPVTDMRYTCQPMTATTAAPRRLSRTGHAPGVPRSCAIASRARASTRGRRAAGAASGGSSTGASGASVISGGKGVARGNAPDRGRARKPAAAVRGFPVSGCGMPGGLEVLARRDPFYLAAALGVFALVHDRAHVDDPFTLLPRDLRPVVGVGGVRKVFVLAELLFDRVEQVLAFDAALAAGDRALDRELLRAPHDVLDHGARREVLEVQELLVAVLVRHLEELVLVAGVVHVLDRDVDHPRDGRLRVAVGLLQRGLRDRQVRREVLLEDLLRARRV